jgi:hypothetical protein
VTAHISLRPDSFVSLGSGTNPPSFEVPGNFTVAQPSRALVLADNDDATGHYSSGTSSIRQVVWQIGMADIAGLIADVDRIESIQCHARMSALGNYDQRLSVAWYRQDLPGETWGRFLYFDDLQVVRDNVVRDTFGQVYARDPLTGLDWTKDAIANLAPGLQFYDATSGIDGSMFLSLFELIVGYRRAGSVLVGAVDNTVTQPVVGWTPSAPDTAMPQERYRVMVFDQAAFNLPGFDGHEMDFAGRATWDSGEVISPWIRGVKVGARLDNNKRYRAYVWVDQPWPGTAGRWWNPVVAYREWFTAMPHLPAPAAPELIGNMDRARVEVILPEAYSTGTSDIAEYEIQRSADAGETWANVRSLPVAQDYPPNSSLPDAEAERGRLLLYRMRAVTEFNTSDWSPTRQVVVPIDGYWLKDPLFGDHNIKIRVVGVELHRPDPQTVVDPLGDDKAIVSGDGLKSWRGSLTIQTENEEEWETLDVLLTSGKKLLLQDPLGWQWYIRTGANQEVERLRAIPDPEAQGRFPIRHLNRVKFDWTEVRTPPIAVPFP